MALNIKSDETDKLARELSEVTGESITTAVTVALKERLARVRRRKRSRAWETEIDEIFARAARAPIKDNRTAEEIVGYNEIGAFD
jgi:antitoxin VapB